jgi:tryptophan 7-halogenase
MVVCGNCQMLVEMLLRSQRAPTGSMRALFNEMTGKSWTDIRDFLALHYKLNGLLDTPFWQHCRNDTPVPDIEPLLDFYRDNGPTGFCRYKMGGARNDFGLEGYLVMLVGNKAPYKKPVIGPTERAAWKNHQSQLMAAAEQGMGVKEALKFVHHPNWQWHGDA